MKQIFKKSPLLFTLVLSFCAHTELKSPCKSPDIEARDGYVSCSSPQPVNEARLILKEERTVT